MTQPPSPTAVILAAGASRRMGTPKALLPWGGATVLGQTLRNIRRSRITDIVIVTGNPADGVAALAREYAVRTVHNLDWASSGMTGSLQAAVRALDPSTSAILVLLADQPLIGPDVIDAVVDAHVAGGHDLAAAASGGRRGHPVLIGRAYFAELLALAPDGAPRELLVRHGDGVRMVDVATDAIFVDLDTPDAYARRRPAPEGGDGGTDDALAPHNISGSM